MKISISLPTALILGIVLSAVAASCTPTADDVQQQRQERILMQGVQTVGLPNIKNFREMRLLKSILEMRDQNDVSTFTYLWSDVLGRWVFLCDSVGYGIPYATQYTSPQKVSGYNGGHYIAVPQADPNGLFAPSSAEGTWVVCKDPNSPKVAPLLIEPRTITSPFKLPLQDSPPLPAAAPSKRP